VIEIGVDVGQGGVRAVRADDGRVAEDERGYWDAPVPVLVRDVVVRLASPAEVSVGVGVTGPVDIAPAVAGELARAGYSGRVVLASDAVTAHLGAFGGAEGVVVVVGTGSAILGAGPLGTALVDGIGHELGDRGSGYWIGRACVRRAIALAEGGEDDPLVAAVIERWGPLELLPARWRQEPPGVREVAGFAVVSAALAEEGSVAAREIWASAGARLASSASAALRRTGASRVALAGGLARAGELLAAPLRAALPPAVRLVPAAGGPREGAAALARRPATAFDAFVFCEVVQ